MAGWSRHRRGQCAGDQQAEVAVPVGQRRGGHIDDVLRLQLEGFGHRQRAGHAGVELEHAGALGRLAHHVDLARVAAQRADAAAFAERLVEGQAAIVHGQGLRRQDFAGHEDLAFVARVHAHDVARRQHHDAGIDFLLHQVAQVDAVALLAALQHDAALVGAGQQPAGRG
jgi:hypothetical protein